MVCLTSCGSQGLPVYTVGARGWHPDRGLSRRWFEALSVTGAGPHMFCSLETRPHL